MGDNGETQDQWIPIDVLLKDYRPGSADGRTWEDEERDILARECLCCGQPGHYQLALEAHIAEHGLDQGVCLGSDGRLWDGHHRVTAARRLGIQQIPLESAEQAGERWVRDHGPVPWQERSSGDITSGELSWVVTDALMKTIGVPQMAREVQP